MFKIQELYCYSSVVRRKFVGKLVGLPERILLKNREASFHSIRNIMVHMIYVEDWLVNSAILGKKGSYREPNFDSFDIPKVISYLNQVESNTKNFLKEATENELRRKIKLRFSPRQKRAYNLTVEECLVQSFTEQLYHIGELIALMWQENIKPPDMQWFSNNPRSQTLIRKRSKT
jgi:uncharacterized damage-inducible protein DinB